MDSIHLAMLEQCDSRRVLAAQEAAESLPKTPIIIETDEVDLEKAIKKLNTIHDFLDNEFTYDCHEYTKAELFEMLTHVERLLETEDGTLTPEQQADANLEHC